MVEFEKKDNGKCLIIRPPMPPDEDEMIKETFFFLKHPNPWGLPTMKLKQTRTKVKDPTANGTLNSQRLERKVSFSLEPTTMRGFVRPSVSKFVGPSIYGSYRSWKE